MSINSANPSKNSPVFKWNTNVVTIAPVDILTRQGISSLNGDPALKTYTRQEYLLEHYFVYDCTVEKYS